MHRRRREQFILPKSNAHPRGPDWPDPLGLDDDALLALIDALTRTHLGFLDPLDADILSRADLRGQSVARIARETGLSEAEVGKSLWAGRQALCRFVVMTLTPVPAAC